MIYSRQNHEGDRVRRYSTAEQLRRIDARTQRQIRLYAAQPRDVIDERIRELRCEWSIERFLQLNAVTVGLVTALLAVTRDRRWGIATCTALGLFLVHAIDGFDPPLPLLRQMGIRSRIEIDREIYALKVLRGDFDTVERIEARGEEPAVREAIGAVGI